MPHYNERHAAYSDASPRASRNIRNGPSPLQTRIFRAAARRPAGSYFAALAAWLTLVLAYLEPVRPPLVALGASRRRLRNGGDAWAPIWRTSSSIYSVFLPGGGSCCCCTGCGRLATGGWRRNCAPPAANSPRRCRASTEQQGIGRLPADGRLAGHRKPCAWPAGAPTCPAPRKRPAARAASSARCWPA